MVLEAKLGTSNRLDHDGKWGARIADIKFLNDITGSLIISHLEHVRSREEASHVCFKSKTNIHQLDLTWSYNATCITNSKEVLEEWHDITIVVDGYKTLATIIT